MQSASGEGRAHLLCACGATGDGLSPGFGATDCVAEAVAEMRRQGHTECELENLLMDFKGIQVTLAVVARAIIAGRIDCKTAGRLVVHLQTMSKLLWTLQKSKSLPLINTDNSDLQDVAKDNPAANERENARIVLISPRFNAEKTELTMVGRVDEDTGAQIRWEDGAYRNRGQAWAAELESGMK